ncbi:MAG: tetratricopeptide repeat protein, partial [Chloroflexi bacterium]|nr:tetratricopeptide repeat protein [Chloroflexota bacterium]
MASLRENLEEARRAAIGGDQEECLRRCQAVLDGYPKCLEAYALFGEACRNLGHIEAAGAVFQRVVSADPESVLGHWALGLIHQQQGDTNRAIGEILIAWEALPTNEELRAELERFSPGLASQLTGGWLVRRYLQQGFYRRAATEARSILADHPNRLDLQVALAEALWRQGEWDEAIDACRSLLERSPDCVKALLILAEIQAQEPLGRREAEALLERVKAIDPLNTIAAQLFAGTTAAQRFAPTDVELLERKEGAAEALVGLAEQEVAAIGAEEALPTREAGPTPALEKAPAPAAEPALAQEIGEPLVAEPTPALEETPTPPFEEAAMAAPPAPEVGEPISIETYHQMLQADPSRHEIRLALAEQYVRQNAIDQALEEYQTVIRLAPSLLEQAVEGLEQVVATRPNHTQAHRLLGDAYVKNGRFR